MAILLGPGCRPIRRLQAPLDTSILRKYSPTSRLRQIIARFLIRHSVFKIPETFIWIFSITAKIANSTPLCCCKTTFASQKRKKKNHHKRCSRCPKQPAPMHQYRNKGDSLSSDKDPKFQPRFVSVFKVVRKRKAVHVLPVIFSSWGRCCWNDMPWVGMKFVIRLGEEGLRADKRGRIV